MAHLWGDLGAASGERRPHHAHLAILLRRRLLRRVHVPRRTSLRPAVAVARAGGPPALPLGGRARRLRLFPLAEVEDAHAVEVDVGARRRRELRVLDGPAGAGAREGLQPAERMLRAGVRGRRAAGWPLVARVLERDAAVLLEERLRTIRPFQSGDSPRNSPRNSPRVPARSG